MILLWRRRLRSLRPQRRFGMKPLILRNVTLNPMVADFVNQYYDVIAVEELTEANAPQIEVLLTNGTGKAPKELLDRLPNLKLIDDFGVGFDGIDIAECQRRNITVCTTPGVLTDDVADLALAHILAFSRQMCKAHHEVVSGAWAQGKKKLGLGRKVSGKRVGIVGLGRIGKAVAQRCYGFNMSLAYYDRFLSEDKAASDLQKLLGVAPQLTRYDNLVELAANCDYLVVCAAATPENHGLINEEVLTALGPKGTLINIARGVLVDEAALVKVLQEGKLGGAGLDVFAHEPNVPEALLTMDNVVLTPHIASATIETRELMANLVIGNLKAFREGTPYLTALEL